MAGEVMAVSLTTVWRNVVQCSRIFGDRVHPNMGIQDVHAYGHGNSKKVWCCNAKKQAENQLQHIRPQSALVINAQDMDFVIYNPVWHGIW